jgi:hypothetical protein
MLLYSILFPLQLERFRYGILYHTNTIQSEREKERGRKSSKKPNLAGGAKERGGKASSGYLMTSARQPISLDRCRAQSPPLAAPHYTARATSLRHRTPQYQINLKIRLCRTNSYILDNNFNRKGVVFIRRGQNQAASSLTSGEGYSLTDRTHHCRLYHAIFVAIDRTVVRRCCCCCRQPSV